MKTLKESILSPEYDGFKFPMNFEGADELLQVLQNTDWITNNRAYYSNNANHRKAIVNDGRGDIRQVWHDIVNAMTYICDHNKKDSKSCPILFDNGVSPRIEIWKLRSQKPGRRAYDSDYITMFMYGMRTAMALDDAAYEEPGPNGAIMTKKGRYKFGYVPEEAYNLLKFWFDIHCK
jgi:hypothetical protein